jgi:alpha-L-fucosidase
MYLRILTIACLFFTQWMAEDVYSDDGIIEPYVPPKEHRDYVSKLPSELVATLRANPKYIEQWQDDKFGVFMHWDPSCQMTGAVSWSRKGRRPHHSSDGTVTKGIPAEIYDNLYKTFNPVKFDADAYARMVKDAGARYLVFTAKHHQGFCMFDSKYTDYDIMSTPLRRDICRELAHACQRHGIRIFWYYSQPDWTEPDYAAPMDSAEFARYRDTFLVGQLKELFINYGRIDGIWWDGLGKHPDTWNTPKLLHMLRQINPDLISNHRCAPRHWRLGDFDGPEKQIGRFQINRPWETCEILGGGWGYGGDRKPLSLRKAIGLLVRCAGSGGNLLLNTGPMPNGAINPRHIERYLQMGAWLKQYGESIYATRGGPYRPGPWGCATRTKNSNAVYLHVLSHWDGVLTLPDLDAKVISAKVLTGGEVEVTQKDGQLQIVLSNDVTNSQPRDVVHDFDTIIALTTNKKAMDIPVVASVEENLTIGAKVSASSQSSEQMPASAVVATNTTEFEEGTFVRAVWEADRRDQEPWLMVEFADEKPIQQIQIQESRLLRSTSRIKHFTISLRIEDNWTVVYEGSEIGSTFGLLLPKPVTADAIRISFLRWEGKVSLNMVNAY